MTRPDTTARTRITERALLGALLIDRNAIASVVERLSPDAFAFPDHQRLYQAVVDCWQRRVPPDVVTVTAVMDRDGLGSYDLAGLSEMMTEAPYGVHAPHYADLVVRAARERAIEEAGSAMVRSANAGDDNPEAAWQDLQVRLAKLGATAQAGPMPYADVIPEWRNEVIAQWMGERESKVTATGFPSLDTHIGGGFHPGELIVLGARPGMGKSALALQIAHQAASLYQRQVLFFSAEMTRDSLLMRAASSRAGVSYFVADRPGLDSRLRERFLAATGDLELLPVAIDDQSGITTAQMQVRIEHALLRGKVGLAIFDYLELAGDDIKGDSEERRVGESIRRLKHIAMACQVPFLAIAQLNRSVESRSGFVPKLADFRYSGAIEANADVALLLYRRDYYVQQGQLESNQAEASLARLIIAKNRNGPTRTVKLTFHEQIMAFEDEYPGSEEF